MKNVKPAVMWVGGWFDAEDLSGPLKLFNSLEKNGAIAPGHAGHGTLAAWRMGARQGRHAGQSQVHGADLGVFPGKHRAGLFRRQPEGQRQRSQSVGRRRRPESLFVRDRTQRVASLRFVAAQERDSPHSVSRRRGKIVDDGSRRPPASTSISSDPNKPVPSVGEIAPEWECRSIT